MKLFILFFTIACVNSILTIHPVFAQEQKSIHQLEWEKYHPLKKGDVFIDIVDKNIKPLSFFKSPQALSKKVFGFLPDWEYPEAMNNLRLDLLTHIAAFDFVVSPDGSIANPAGWPWTNLINEAHSNGVKVILTAVNFDASEIHTIITNEAVKNKFFTNLQNKISLYQLDGVNIDFESLNSADRGQPINNFMAELTAFMHSNLPGSEVSFDGPAVNWSNYWDFAGLAAACDYIFIMGYAFSGGWSDNAGSTAPLIGGSINITNTVQTQYAAVVNATPEKLILGVPYYGQEFQTVNEQAHADVISHVSSVRFRIAKSGFDSYGTLWDAATASPWYRFQNNSSWHQVWCDNAESLDDKFNLADNKNLLGVGMWALNYDGSENDFWDVILDHYGAITNLPSQEIDKPQEFTLYQSYPNPFNPVTHIKFYLDKAGWVTVKVYDIMGREAASLTNAYMESGVQIVDFDASGMTSGIYIYEVTFGKQKWRNKMMLVK